MARYFEGFPRFGKTDRYLKHIRAKRNLVFEPGACEIEVRAYLADRLLCNFDGVVGPEDFIIGGGDGICEVVADCLERHFRDTQLRDRGPAAVIRAPSLKERPLEEKLSVPIVKGSRIIELVERVKSRGWREGEIARQSSLCKLVAEDSRRKIASRKGFSNGQLWIKTRLRLLCGSPRLLDSFLSHNHVRT